MYQNYKRYIFLRLVYLKSKQISRVFEEIVFIGVHAKGVDAFFVAFAQLNIVKAAWISGVKVDGIAQPTHRMCADKLPLRRQPADMTGLKTITEDVRRGGLMQENSGTALRDASAALYGG